MKINITESGLRKIISKSINEALEKYQNSDKFAEIKARFIEDGYYDNFFINGLVGGSGSIEQIRQAIIHELTSYNDTFSDNGFRIINSAIDKRYEHLKESCARYKEMLDGIRSGKYDEMFRNGGINRFISQTGFPKKWNDVLLSNILYRKRSSGQLKSDNSNFKLKKEMDGDDGVYLVLDTNEYVENGQSFFNYDESEERYSYPGYLQFVILNKKDAVEFLRGVENVESMVNSSTQKIVFIMALYISPNYRKIGFARALLNTLINDYKGYTIALTANSCAMSDSDISRLNNDTGFDNADSAGLEQEKLIQMYRRFGFVGGDGYRMNSLMVRQPK